MYDALEYAENLGIKRHKNFSITEHLLADSIDLEFEEIEFGLHRIPYYIYYEGDKKGE